MSSILYYSKFCEHSKKLLENLSRSNVSKDIHFICIDKRVKENNKIFIILDNGQKIVMPENVNRVPALLLLNQGYQVLYGESILNHLKPRQEIEKKVATQSNMEPMAFSFGGGGFGDIVSDQYSFLDQNEEELKASGNGGLRQMHNYVDINNSNIFSGSINTTANESEYKKGTKMPEGMTVEKLMEERESELRKLVGNRPPVI
jgi:hypothetical protein